MHAFLCFVSAKGDKEKQAEEKDLWALPARSGLPCFGIKFYA